MPWKLKIEEDAPVLKDGHPVYVDDDGNETAFDVNQLHGKILDLNSESKKRREENKSLKEQMSLLDGIEDLAEYRKQADNAMKTVQNLKEKDLEKAEKVEKLKSEMKAGFEEQERKLKDQFTSREKELIDQLQTKDAAIRQLMVSSRFARHNLFSGDNPKTTLPPDIAETYFGRYFDVVMEDEKEPRIVAKDDSGEPIYSRQKIGEYADFEEAIELIFDKYPGKDKLLRASSGGSGSGGGQGSVTTQTPVAKLQTEIEQATKNQDWQRRIALENQLHDALKKQRQ